MAPAVMLRSCRLRLAVVALGVLGLLPVACALPPFSWETLPLYVHCANQTGPLSPAFRARAADPFVTLEKWHCLDWPPRTTVRKKRWRRKASDSRR